MGVWRLLTSDVLYPAQRNTRAQGLHGRTAHTPSLAALARRRSRFTAPRVPARTQEAAHTPSLAALARRRCTSPRATLIRVRPTQLQWGASPPPRTRAASAPGPCGGEAASAWAVVQSAPGSHADGYSASYLRQHGTPVSLPRALRQAQTALRARPRLSAETRTAVARVRAALAAATRTLAEPLSWRKSFEGPHERSSTRASLFFRTLFS